MKKRQCTDEEAVNVEVNEDDSLVVINFRNEDGQHVGYLVCERSKITDEQFQLCKNLQEDEEGTWGPSYKTLEDQKVLCYELTSNCFSDCERDTFSFRLVGDLRDTSHFNNLFICSLIDCPTWR